MHEPRGFVKKKNDCSSIPNYTRLIIWLHINNILQWKRRDVKLHAHNDRQFCWVISHFTEFCFLDIDDHAFSWPQFFVLLCVIWKLYLSIAIGIVYVMWGLVWDIHDLRSYLAHKKKRTLRVAFETEMIATISCLWHLSEISLERCTKLTSDFRKVERYFVHRHAKFVLSQRIFLRSASWNVHKY